MFERYTELARRVLFFARYEASVFGSDYLEAEHVLLGLLRENRNMVAEPGEIRKEIESQAAVRPKGSTSVDLPLSVQTKLALDYAESEAESLDHDYVDCGHLMLGILRLENSVAVAILRRHNVDYATFREGVRVAPAPKSALESRYSGKRETRASERPNVWHSVAHKEPTAPSLSEPIAALEHLIDTSIAHLHTYSDVYGEQKLKRKPWSRKQALGHLADLATTHHNWFVRAMTEPKIAVSGYPEAEWVSAQQYETFSWPDLVDLWVGLNRLLVHVLLLIPEDKMNTPCRVGIEEPVPLSRLIERYVESCQDILGHGCKRPSEAAR